MMSIPDANLSLGEAVAIAPFIDYARCIDASGRPHDHVGDWLVEGKVYAVRVVQNPRQGYTLVYVLLLTAEAPYFNSFAPHRFRMLCSTWLN
ncbi:hypothetical protein [Hymenobacter sp. CRA2]|uniref:hypothetical protein n=1 Tax=Hymenobacter sp. CRA2 TaxID=1955620 RepID=UPI00098FF55D|nr:hypothetical protein [Hymenobacter sp. CRA2]OON68749.1 hypothetical protein B0919_11200 [Hymenobacter sp. CRA2]